MPKVKEVVNTNGEFDVNLILNVSVKKNGEDWYSTDSNIDYKGMDYLQVVSTNAAVVKFADILADFGWDAALLKGFPKELIEASKAAIK